MLFNFRIFAVIFILTFVLSPSLSLAADDRDPTENPETPGHPNILWIISEDNSKHYLKHFDAGGAPAPAIEALARNGLTFDHAFSNAPVCSVARTTLITSCYAPRIGTQHHRPMVPALMPAGVKMFPTYLRHAGYYTTNQHKEDYNVAKGPKAWDDSSKGASWKNRPTDQTPFFHVQTTTLSHESSLHPRGDQPPTDQPPTDQPLKPPTTPPHSVELQPYFPDTPTFRETRALYHDRMSQVDNEVKRIVDELTQAGELENTFLFYFGDHGGVLPRSKGYAYESGLHVPLVIRIPENYSALVDRKRGDRVKGFVEFVDFGPTVLNLAGVPIPSAAPSGIDGESFLGPGVDSTEVDQRDEALGYADRLDEKYDMVRTLRVGKWKYIRNFEPFYPDAMYNEYRYKMEAFTQWRDLHKQGSLTPLQDAFFQPKATEALYDLTFDPHETRNLATDPKHQSKLTELRDRLMQRLDEMHDLSFFPEAYLIEDAMTDPESFGRRRRDLISECLETVNLALLPWKDARRKIAFAINSQEPLVRYWGLVAATSFDDQAKEIAELVEKRLLDPEPLVVMRAAEYFAWLERSGDDTLKDPRPFLVRSLARCTNEPEALRVLNTMVFVQDHCGDQFPIDPKELHLIIPVSPKSQLARRLNYLRNPR